MSALPRIVLVGRANVGKSTLFNRLVGRRRALVFDRPGVTRDCLAEEGPGPVGPVTWVDTAGVDGEAEDGQLAAAADAAREAQVRRAAAVVWVVDRTVGVIPRDQSLACWLRRLGRPVVVACNKADHPMHDADAEAFWALGMGPPIPLSAEHGRGLDPLWSRLEPLLAERQEAAGPVADAAADLAAELAAVADADADAPAAADRPAEAARGASAGAAARAPADAAAVVVTRSAERVVLLGRPNVGKSSLANRLAGDLCLVTSARAGTTRDAVAVAGRGGAEPYTWVDTAGIARRRERQGLGGLVDRATFRALAAAQLAVVVMDGSQPAGVADARLVAAAAEAGRAVVIAANKVDLMSGAAARAAWLAALEPQLATFPWVSCCWISAHTGAGIERLLAEVARAAASWQRRVPTGPLNRTIERLVRLHPPPAVRGRRPRIAFATQPEVGPPTVVLKARHADIIGPDYARYLSRGLRAEHDFAGAPVWLKFRPAAPTRA